MLLILALTALASAEPAPWRYDLAVQRFVDQQSQAVSESGTLLEDWLSGRLSTERALAKLEERQDAVLAYQDKLKTAPCPKALQGYRKVALDRSQAHLRALARIAVFLKAGKNDRSSVQRFSQDLNGILSQAQRTWLKQRQAWLPRLRPGGPGAYYDWQARVLPYQQREAELSGRLQHLVYQGNAREPDLPALARDGKTLMQAIGKLRAEVAAMPDRQPYQQAYLDELSTLERVAEAVMLMGQDPSSDSLSRLKRLARQLVDRSRAAQESALQGLGG